MTPEQREAIYRLALQQQFAELSDYLDSITSPEEQQVPLPPLPKSHEIVGSYMGWYSPSQMHEYAKAALAAHDIGSEK